MLCGSGEICTWSGSSWTLQKRELCKSLTFPQGRPLQQRPDSGTCHHLNKKQLNWSLFIFSEVLVTVIVLAPFIVTRALGKCWCLGAWLGTALFFSCVPFRFPSLDPTKWNCDHSLIQHFKISLLKSYGEHSNHTCHCCQNSQLLSSQRSSSLFAMHHTGHSIAATLATKSKQGRWFCHAMSGTWQISLPPKLHSSWTGWLWMAGQIWPMSCKLLTTKCGWSALHRFLTRSEGIRIYAIPISNNLLEMPEVYHLSLISFRMFI